MNESRSDLNMFPVNLSNRGELYLMLKFYVNINTWMLCVHV